MNRLTGTSLAPFVALCLGSSASLADPIAAAPVPDNNPPANWSAPARLSPFPTTPAQDGEVVWAWVPGAGMVQATRQTMMGIGRPLQAGPGPNRTVEPCRKAAWAEGAKLGARGVEAVSAGRQRVNRSGHAAAPVLMRMTYAGLMSYEVRDAVMTCTIDRTGRVIDSRM